VERRAGKKRDRGTLTIGARRGRFARSYRFHSAGLFRFYVAFGGDKSNAATKSGAVYVRVTPAAAKARSKTTPQGGAGDEQQSPNGGGGAPAP
jgi:hypothetical protein